MGPVIVGRSLTEKGQTIVAVRKLLRMVHKRFTDRPVHHGVTLAHTNISGEQKVVGIVVHVINEIDEPSEYECSRNPGLLHRR